MREKRILSVAFLWLLFFLSGCFDSSYDYTSDFEKVGEKSVTGSERDTSLTNCSLSGHFDYFLKLVPVEVEVVAIDENFKEKKTITGKISEDGYSFSVDKFSYPTSLVKIRYTLKNPTQDLKMDFSQYANIADEHNLWITLASAIKGPRIENLIENDAFSFDGADLKATRELYHILRLDSATMGLKSSDSLSHWLALNIMNSYVETMSYSYLGRNFDSTFQKRFESLSLALGDENLWWNFVSEVEIADTVVRDFRDRVIPMDKFLKPFADFWSGAYKLPICDSSIFLDTIKNPEKISAHFDDVFICYKGRGDNAFYYWHPLNEMEKEIGLCPLDNQCSRSYDNSVYVSNKNDMDWRRGNAKETVVYLYGECDQEKLNQVRIIRDTMFLCDKDYKNFFWTQNFDTSRVSHEALMESYALRKYGKCSDEKDLAKFEIGTTDFVQCVNGKWTNISEAFFYGDSCTEARSGETLRTPNAKYYKCKKHWFSGEYEWADILATEYYGDVCNNDSNKTILEYDGVFFKCNCEEGLKSGEWNVLEEKDILPPISHKDTCREKKVVKYDDVYYMCRDREWIALSKDEAIPPIVDELPCGSNEENTYVNYDDDFYICIGGKWSFVEKKNVPFPEIYGDTCDSRYWGHMVEYNGEYFICSKNSSGSTEGFWSKAKETSVTIFEYNKVRASYCASGQMGTTLEWNPKIESLMGCVKNTKTAVYEWGFVRPRNPTSMNEKVFAGGEFKAEGEYEVSVDGITYEFDGFQLSRSSDVWNENILAYMYNHHVIIDDGRYEAEWVDSNLYINSERGEVAVDLSDIEPKSDSYSAFYEVWLDWVDRSNTCNGNAYGFHFPITSIQMKQYGDGVFADWNTAKTFCPKGFHIPDTTEWNVSKINTHTNAIASIEESYEPDHGRCGAKYSKNFVLLWSSTEKDSDTQYCLGYTTTQPYGDNRKDLLECPKDLFPLGQVMCVKDK